MRRTELPIAIDGIVDVAWAGAPEQTVSNVVSGVVSGQAT